MAAIANITIKAANGTTDVVLTGITGSPGDGIPARWRVEDAVLPVGQRKNSSQMALWNAKKDARRVVTAFKYPVVRTVNSVPTLIGTIPFEMVGTMGEQYLQSEIDEAVAHAVNFFAHASVREGYKTGYSPT